MHFQNSATYVLSIFNFSFLCFVTLTVEACFPRRSDVSLTSRGQHLTGMGNANTNKPWLDTDEAERAFLATRVDWVYTTNASFIQHSRLPIQATINANLPDTFDGPDTFEIGRIRNLYGERITAPWMSTFKPVPYYGCVNNPDYVKLERERALRLIAPIHLGGVGSCGLQHDDPWANYESVSWPEGGCYCKHCIEKFANYLVAEKILVPPPEGNHSGSFNYSEYLLSQGGYGKGSKELKVAFESFQAKSVQLHYVELMAALRNASRHHPDETSVCPCPFSMSGNVPPGTWSEAVRNITAPLDYYISELYEKDPSPDLLYSQLMPESEGGLLPNGKQRVLTMPKLPVVTTELKVQTRKVAGLCVALGTHMIVPWDIYLPGPHAFRFYGNVSDYVDQSQFVRQWPEVLENCSDLVGSWYHQKHKRATNDSWNVLVPETEAVFWTVRMAPSTKWPSSSGGSSSSSSDSFEGGYSVIHLVDWAWAGDANVEYPLPSNPGRSLVIECYPPAAARLTVASVEWLEPSGMAVALNFTRNNGSGSGVMFNTTIDMLRPWAAVRLSW